jgi:hypothetical protein
MTHRRLFVDKELGGAKAKDDVFVEKVRADARTQNLFIVECIVSHYRSTLKT